MRWISGSFQLQNRYQRRFVLARVIAVITKIWHLFKFQFRDKNLRVGALNRVFFLGGRRKKEKNTEKNCFRFINKNTTTRWRKTQKEAPSKKSFSIMARRYSRIQKRKNFRGLSHVAAVKKWFSLTQFSNLIRHWFLERLAARTIRKKSPSEKREREIH